MTTETPDELAANENGDATVDPAGDLDEDDGPVDVEPQLALPGFRTGALTMGVGKGRPSSAEFRMRSLSLPLGGQLELDAKVWLLVEADVDDVGVKNHRKGRTVTARVRRHVATPQSVRVLTADELEHLGIGTGAA